MFHWNGQLLPPLVPFSLNPFMMKNIKMLLVMLAVMICSQAVYSQASLKRANKQYELSVFSEAVNSYKDVLRKNPDHREANVKIADCYRHLNQLEKAMPHYQSALANGGIESIYVFQYGLTLQGLGRYELAKKLFEKLAVNDPKFMIRGKHFAEACDFAMTPQGPARYKVTNEYLNKASADFGPAIFKGERVIYSSSRGDVSSRDSRNAPSGKTFGANRLLITQRDKNGYLEMPTALHAGFGTATNEGPVSYSNSGRMVAFTKNNYTEGVRQIPSSGLELTLYIAEVNSNGDWNNATPFPHNGTSYSTGYPSFSPDGKALFFSSDRPGGYGGFDIYVSYRVGNSWSAPENLGLTVNSLGNEISPFYDGQSLYLSSDFHKGFGGFDIFRAEESNGRWATLFHGGSGLNSSYDDYGFVFDGLQSIGYFVSNRAGGKGNEDIYKAEKETDNVVIKVSDASSGTPIAEASIDFADCEEEVYYTNDNGVFNFQMLEDLNCTVYIKKDGYMNTPLKLTSMGLKQSRTLEVQLTNLQNAYQGKTVNASNGRYLENVKIIANDQKTGNVTSVYSDSQGGYFISLKPNSAYLLRFSKPGFQDITLNVKTSLNDNRVLRNIDLLAVGATGKITTTSEPIMFSAPTPATAKNKTSSSKTIAPGYAIQVAALSNDMSGIGDYKDKLGDIGTVYSVNEGGKVKVRVGVFADRDDAVAIQKLVRAKGYNGAFIIIEKTREVTAVNKNTPAPKQYETPVAAVTDLKGYMIRLAAYSNLNFFDKGAVDDLGTPTYVPKGELTIVLLRGYSTPDDAYIALRKVKMRGYPEAYLVNYKNGEMKRVR